MDLAVGDSVLPSTASPEKKQNQKKENVK